MGCEIASFVSARGLGATGREVVLELGVAELVGGAGDAQQPESVGVIEEGQEPPR